MIQIVLCENDNIMKRRVLDVIERFVKNSINDYQVHDLDGKSRDVIKKINKISGLKIFIIDIDHEYGGLNIARTIREAGDYSSPILLLSSGKLDMIIKELNNIMYLEIINKKEDIDKSLFMGLNNAYRIISRNDAYTFSIFDELYRLPYDEIFMIIKNIHDDSVTVYTRDDSYHQYKTIKGVEEDLKNDPRFFKSHRSCVINLYNVKSYNKKDNIILLKNGMTTNLVSRSRRQLLLEKLKQVNCDVRI